MQGEYITDDAWKKMLKFFEAHPRIYRCSEHKLKKFVSGIYWITRTGAQWRALPKEFGMWNSVFRRFKRWVKMGIWEDLRKTINSGAGT